MGVEHLLPPLVIGPDPNNPCAGGKKCYTDQYGQWDCNTGSPCSPTPKCPSANITLEERGYEFSTPVEGENCVTETEKSVKRKTEVQIEAEIGEKCNIRLHKIELRRLLFISWRRPRCSSFSWTRSLYLERNSSH